MQEEEKQRAERFRQIWYRRLQGEQKRARYTPWLVIPAALTDYGARPLDGSLAHWCSPHIGVFSPDPSGLALAGAQNTVWARVFNLGAMTSAPTRVRFFWADPSVGLGANDAQFIGETMIEVPPMKSVLVECPVPWVPSYLNNGHECLFVEAGNQIFDPVTAPFAPRQDRHVGQRNIQVLPAVDQTMMMWIPGGTGALRGELRALVLRGRARELVMQETPVATLMQIVNAIQQGFGQGTRGHRAIAVRREPPEAAIRKVTLTDEARKAHDEAAPTHREPTANADRWGERILELTTKPGLHQQIRIDFHDLELARDEVMHVQLTWLAEGRLVGGYTVALADRNWFADANTKVKQQGGVMSASKDGYEDLRDLVIHHNPHAQATLTIAKQLHDDLPIKSARQLRDGIKLGEAYISPEVLDQLGAALFPIETAEDLVKRVGAMLRMFTAFAAQNPASLSAPEWLLHSRLTGAGPRESVRQVLVAQGEPIFALPPEEKE
ncbi:hypothetical protein [Porphyrobacter sp. ULC335]|uniref:hypothetical protein n=1 Tax=Porphyrobacter sp. ULC335 TaxID=2854260 RepID=UPI00221F70BA|nr:hypothetical protein [Porphyrobacter sp. ULC335]UYV16644.1 hypothetical protein KVF90_04805 [Porphyrobacter sp. ULC335]